MPRERFNRLLERLQEPGIEISPSDFLHHSWLSRHDYVSRKSLFREMKARLRTADQKASYLRELEQDLSLYIKARRSGSVEWRREMGPVVRSLRALDVFKMTQPVPLILAGLRAYELEQSITIRQLKRLLRSLEAFHFKYTAISGKSLSGGISFRYAAHARRLREDENHVANIDELVRKLRDALPVRDEFIAAFKSLGYSSTYTVDKALVRYVLEEFYRESAQAVRSTSRP